MTKVSSTTEDNATEHPFSPNDTLPPVEVPTAGFILQLFIIPAIIVVIIATVWLLFSWVAHLGSSPEKLVQDLVRGGDHSWQTAWNLAKELQKPGNAGFRQNQELASRLATLLQDTLEVPYPTGNSPQDQSERKAAIQSRVFLCRALGEFELSLVIPALAAAAKREDYVAQSADDFGDNYVRQSAIEAIAVLAQNVIGVTARLSGAALPSHHRRTLLPAKVAIGAKAPRGGHARTPEGPRGLLLSWNQ